MEFLYIVILPLFGILALWSVGTIIYGYWEGLHSFEPITDVNSKNKLFENSFANEDFNHCGGFRIIDFGCAHFDFDHPDRDDFESSI